MRPWLWIHVPAFVIVWVVVDGTVNGIGALAGGTGRELRRIQTGRVQNYALGIALGLLVMAGSYLLLAGR